MDIESIQGELMIPSISKENRFWMIRTKGGFFYNEFVNKKFIAIGWNYLLSNTLKLKISKRELDIIKANIKKTYKTDYPGNIFKKCDRFFREIKVGDIAMIVDNKRITFAYIGEYYEEQDARINVEEELSVIRQIETRTATADTPCPYKKRRKIEIIKELSTTEPINPYLYKAMSMNRHSLSCLDEYSGVILSSCFDIYQLDRTISMTFRVKKRKGINPIDLAEFLKSVTLLLQSEADLDLTNDVTAQTTLNSPGEIIINFLDKVPWQTVLIIYLAIFGGNIGGVQLPSLISIIKDFANAKTTRELRENEVELSRLSIDAVKLDNEKKRYEIDRMQLENKVINDNYEALLKSSKKLEILPFSKSIMPLEDITISPARKNKKN